MDDLVEYARGLSSFGRQCLHLTRLNRLANLRKQIIELLEEYRTAKEEEMTVLGVIHSSDVPLLPSAKQALKGLGRNGWHHAVCLTCWGDVLDAYECAAHRAQGHIVLEYHETNGTKLAN